MILLALGAVNALGEPMNAETIVTGEWKPYVSRDIDGHGFIAEIVTAVLNDMDIKPQYAFLHFYKCYKLVRENRYVGTFPFHKFESREKDMFFSAPIMDVQYVFFYNKRLHKENTVIGGPKDFKGKKVAVIHGYPVEYSYGKEFQKHIDAMAIVKVNSEIEAFDMLDKGKVDLVPAEERVGRNIIRRHFVQYKYGIIPGLSSKETVHFIASKSDPANQKFIEKFNNALAKIRENGIYENIKRQRYDPDLDLYQGEKQTGVVRLNATDAFPLILARENRTEKNVERRDSPAYLIPNGTRAIVLEWSEKFWQADKFEIHDQMFSESQVQLIEGPLKGRSLWTKNLHIQFE